MSSTSIKRCLWRNKFKIPCEEFIISHNSGNLLQLRKMDVIQIRTTALISKAIFWFIPCASLDSRCEMDLSSMKLGTKRCASN